MKRSIPRTLILILALVASTAGSLAAIDGPLRVHPTNPRYLTDDSGEVVFLAGSHTWSVFQDYRGPGTCSVNPPPLFDHGAWLDTLDDRGHNFYRGWHWGDNYYSPRPYVKVDGKYDLTQIKPGYLNRLYNRVNAARARGIYVSVMLFEGWSVSEKDFGKGPLRIPDPWLRHFYHVDWNLQGIDGDTNGDGEGLEIHEAGNPGWDYQVGYIKAVIDKLNCLDNVIWEVSNESHADSHDWQFDVIDVIRTHTPANCPGKEHPTWMTCPANNNFLRDGDNHADIVSPCHRSGFNYRGNPPAADGSKVFIADSDHTEPCKVNYVWALRSFMRGLQPILMDRYEDLCWATIDDPENCALTQSKAAKVHDAIGVMKVLADTKLDLASMAPQKETATTPSSNRYALFSTNSPGSSNPAPNGKEFLVYERTGSATFTLCNLVVNAGYSFEWINPLTAVVQESGSFTGPAGSCKNFTNPAGWSRLLHVTQLPVPDSPNLTAPANGAWVFLTPALAWSAVTANPAVDQYQVQVRRSSNGSLVHSKTLTATSYQVPAGVLADKVTYKWRVRAHNSAGWGAWSGYRTFLVRAYAKVDLGLNSDLEDGISRPSPEPPDGKTVGQTITNACDGVNVQLRKNRGEAVSPAARYLYFRVDDQFIKNGSHKKVDFYVQYRDSSPPANGWSSQFCIQYQATGGVKTAGCKTVGNTGCMKAVTFSVTDAYFGNGQNGGSDFRIFAGHGNTRRFVNEVKVTKR